ncbi:MAG: M23 family metallopeptidase [Chloroflexota bacterium]
MEFQIILLPRQDYWTWVRACRDYVLAFGANLTPDPETAARYMAPRQVVTFPDVPDGYPEYGDLKPWFAANHFAVRLDVIEASEPAALEAEFKRRIEDKDRYGQNRRQFKLLWPTDFPVITQKFGANPQIYRRWNLPGHEGLDIRAFTNANIYACADGTVFEIWPHAWGHPYGIHVRLQHRDGYRTIYAHLKKVLVSVGEAVKTGQVIAKADSTGNSTGAHLHLTLKRDGATERGETSYPKDIIDPTPFLIWPEEGQAKAVPHSLPGLDWPASRCLLGAVGRVGGKLESEDLAAIAEARLEAVLISQDEPSSTIERLREINPALFLLARLTTLFSGEAVPPASFVDRVDPDLARLYGLGVRYFEIHAAPNLQIEGWQRTWMTGADFALWFQEVVERLRQKHPEGRFGFPGLAPGGRIPGQRADAAAFLDDAEAAVAAAGWVGLYSYWTSPAEFSSLSGGLLAQEYRLRFPDKLLFVTEFANLSSAASERQRAQEYLGFLRRLQEIPGVGAAFAFAVSSADGHQDIVWRRGSGPAGLIPSLLGARPL